MQIKLVLENQLMSKVLPFWLSQQDNVNGGFYGKLSIDLKSYPLAPKGGVMMSRFLWTFSHSYETMKKDEYKLAADHAYRFMLDTLWDMKYGGIFWLVDAEGKPVNLIKHVYAQSFAIYGLSEYAKINPDSDALEYAKKLYLLIEEHAYNPTTLGYEEEFDQVWKKKPLSQVASQNSKVRYTTNTHLHLLEAYTNLYTVWPNEALLEKIQHLLKLFTTRIFHPAGYCQQEFDQNWNSVIPEVSYGHDIETSWLLDETLEHCKINDELDKEVRDMTASLAAYCYENGLDETGWMINHADGSHLDQTKVWWVEAEAIIGLYHAFQQSGNLEYRKAALKLIQLVQQNFVDDRPGSEWYSRLDKNNQLLSVFLKNGNSEENISDIWKGPYHTVRFYLEMIKRLEEN
ncbi:AGE family epimerase/isomerase [Carnobacterium sp.]|uniref:AGE family epimerase/isomerase n=1 Tax=Carnobacterium sp. TaxID=48221 RepID=UPI00388FA405